jgi:ankyrin repeat protein
MVSRNPLISAAKRGNTEMVRLLIRAGANVNAKDEEYMTALMWALERGHRNVSRLLIHAGANVRAAVHYIQNNGMRNMFARAISQRRIARKVVRSAEQRFRRRKATSLLMSPRLLGRTTLKSNDIRKIASHLSAVKR